MRFLKDTEERSESLLAKALSRTPHVIHASEYPKEAKILSDILKTCDENNDSIDTLAILKLGEFLFIAPTVFGDANDPTEKNITDSAVAYVAEYLSIFYNKETSSSELAEMCFLSESQLRRRFLKEYGMPPIAYRNKIRCTIAGDLLLRTSFSVAEISDRVGYNTVSDFYRAFKKSYGISPTSYRAERKRKAANSPPSEKA